MEVGWASDSLPTAQSFTKALSSALWYLDPHHDALCEWGIKLPAPFNKFQGYNDYKRKKERKPRLSQEGLSRHVQALSNFLSQAWFTRGRYMVLHGKVEEIVESMRKYEQYLCRSAGEKCQYSKKKSHNQVHPMVVEPKIWHQVGMGIIGPLQETHCYPDRILLQMSWSCSSATVFSPGMFQGMSAVYGWGMACGHIKILGNFLSHIKEKSVLKACRVDMP